MFSRQQSQVLGCLLVVYRLAQPIAVVHHVTRLLS
jgi:hypothetical protein